MIDLGGGLWMIITVLFVCLLAAAMAYGIWASRNAPRDAVTMERKNKATRENFSEDAVEERPLLGDRKSR
jgi:flagellar basal body-associated protein FliL